MPGPGEVVELPFAGRTALAATVQRAEDVAEAVRSLGLAEPRPTLVLVGGAGGLGARREEQVRPFIDDVLVPIVGEVAGAVVDGGTDSGVMRLMGDAAARAAQAGRAFPLVGVVAIGTVALPGERLTQKGDAEGTARLEPHHSHFVLVPGDDWGDESEWLSLVATVLAGPRPSATVLVNGGETAWRDVEASVAAGRPVIVVGGTGRAAEDITAALGSTEPGDRGYRLAASGLVDAVPLDAGAGRLAQAVRALLGG